MLGVCDFLVRGWFHPRTKRCGRKRRKKTKLHISRLNWEDFLAFCVCQGWWLAILAGDSRTERIGRAAGNSLAKESMMRLVGAPVEVEDQDVELFERCCGSCECLADVGMRTVRGRAFRVSSSLLGTLGLRNATTFVALSEAAAVLACHD
jgi:hypothetical protein